LPGKFLQFVKTEIRFIQRCRRLPTWSVGLGICHGKQIKLTRIQKKLGRQMHHQTRIRGRQLRRCGFTLIELVVVVLILGIIGAIAAPKMMNTMATAKTNSAMQNLQTIRSAIEMYKTQDANNAYPPAPTLATSLQPYLKGPFPACPIGQQTATVFASSANPLVTTATTDGWLYNQTTGDFAINDSVGIAY
jgi:general secretion pathway protein G